MELDLQISMKGKCKYTVANNSFLFVNNKQFLLHVSILQHHPQDYVSELRPPTGLLFVSQMIYEYGERR
jgi:hypothetical protein